MAFQILLLCLLIIPTSTVASPLVNYSEICGVIIPQSFPVSPITNESLSFVFNSGYFTGGDEFLAPSGGDAVQRFLSFRSHKLFSTAAAGTIWLEATLTLRSVVRPRGRFLKHVVSLPKLRKISGSINIDLSGIWSEKSGRMCLMGSGIGRSVEGLSGEVSAVFKLNCTRKSSISNVFAVGSLESLENAGAFGYFGPVAMMVYFRRQYEYNLIPQIERMNREMGSMGDTLSLVGGGDKACFLMKSIANAGGMKLEYAADCEDIRCSPFGTEIQLGLAFLRDFQCEVNGRLYFNVLFSDEDYGSQQFDPSRMLASEGFWDQERSRFTMEACRLKDLSESALTDNDCGIWFSFWFPKFLTIKNRNLLVGQIWSNKSRNSSGYFETIVVHGSDLYMGSVPGLKYNFTKKADLAQLCSEGNSNKSIGNLYPDRSTFRGLTFRFSLKDSAGKFFPGSMSLFSIGESIYNRFLSEDASLPSAMLAEMNNTSWNVSYRIIFSHQELAGSFPAGFSDISAEGAYNCKTGVLCLVGCMTLPSNYKKLAKSRDSTDCEIAIKVQFPSSSQTGQKHITGSIESRRQNGDPLYFKSMEISSLVMYHSDVVQTMWRMDVEITMILISLTFSCFIIGWQLCYVKKNPGVLSKISIMMLSILTLGHVIPLILNFDALYLATHNKQTALYAIRGWLETDEIIVRIMMVVASFLQFWLLQVTWSARSADDHKQELWTAEIRSFLICLPLYFIVTVIVWTFDLRSYKFKSPTAVGVGKNGHFWGNIMIFFGLVLDVFLLPQILLNVLLNSSDKILTPAYYVGTMAVRAVPHIYDVYRVYRDMSMFSSTYIYASPKENFFSAAWDIFIPIGGFASVIVLFLQQKFGGRSILPLRFKKSVGYEVVPVTVNG